MATVEELQAELAATQAMLATAKQRIQSLKADYRNRHQRVLDRQTALRNVLNEVFDELSTRVSPGVLNAIKTALNPVMTSTRTEMQAVEDTRPDLPIDV